MPVPRLIFALEAGALALPEGRVAVFGPAAGTDLSALGPDRVQVITGFRPDHDWFAAQGYTVARQPQGAFSAAVVFAPRAKEAARGRIAAAARTAGAGLLVVEGAREDGIDSLLKDLRARDAVDDGVSKSHGRVLWKSAPPDLSDWAQAALPRDIGGWMTLPGAFSSDAPDPGSVALLEQLPPLKGRAADFGAGWGFLARGVLERSPDLTEMHLIEADADALDCARANVTDPRAQFHWADATRAAPGAPFNAVVMNPPFHPSRRADPGLGRSFLRAAAAALTRDGTLWVVANRHLPYEGALTEAFVEVEERPGTPAYKITRASRPRRR